MMHVSGEHYNVGHPQKYVGASLNNAYEARGNPNSLKAKLPLAYLDNAVYKFLVDSCLWPYKDWTTDFEDKPTLVEHFVWLSEETMPFCTDPGNRMSHPISPWAWQMSVTGRHGPGRHHGSSTLRNVQSWSAQALILRARVQGIIPRRESGRRNTVVGRSQNLR